MLNNHTSSIPQESTVNNWKVLIEKANEYAESDIERVRSETPYKDLEAEFRKETGEQALEAREALKRELATEVRNNPYAYPPKDGVVGVIVNSDGTVFDADVTNVVENRLLPQAEYLQSGQGLAKARTRAENHAKMDPPAPMYNLTNFLKADIEPLKHRIEELSLCSGYLLISAEYKVGKSTFMMNMMKSLADNEPFLGRPVTPLEEGRSIVYWDLEQAEAYTQKQFAAMQIVNTDVIYPYNGRGRNIDVLSEEFQKDTIRILKDLNCEILIVDTFTQAFDGEENSNSEQRDWFKAMDKIVKLGGVSDLIIVGHMGHGGDHNRGGGYISGHVDSIVNIKRAKKDFENTIREVSITGRDLDSHTMYYDYDVDSKRIRVSDGPSQVVTQATATFNDQVWKYLSDHPESTATGIARGLFNDDSQRVKVGKLVQKWENEGSTTHFVGASNGKYYSVVQLVVNSTTDLLLPGNEPNQ